MDQQLATSARLNNQAIDLLNQGEYHEAIIKLTSSLHIVKNLMGPISVDDENDQNISMQVEETCEQGSRNNDIVFCEPRGSFECRQTPNQCESSLDMPIEYETSHPHALQKDISSTNVSMGQNLISPNGDFNDRQEKYVYDTFLHIWPSALVGRVVTTHLLSELSVALMFNLALCHHMRALHADSCTKSVVESPSVKMVLNQAVCLYELAYEVQMQEDIEVSIECTMAIVNNLGHIHQRLGNLEKASKCFSHLLATLLFVQSSTVCYEWDDLQVSEISMDGFLRIVSSLILSEKVAAAA